MTKIQLENKLLKLEQENESLIKELIGVDQLMRDVGFIDGLNSLKITAEKIHENPENERSSRD